MKNIYILSVLLALSSCNARLNNSEIQVYYPLDSLIEAQVGYLASNNASLNKSNNDSMNNDNSYLLDSIGWVKELEIFQSLSINKPKLVDAYFIEKYKDDKSNLDILSYTTTNETLEVQSIKIYYFQSFNYIKRISAQVNKSNTLYNSKKSLQMEFVQSNATTVLKSYSIIGLQKMTLRDSVSVSIFGRIHF